MSLRNRLTLFFTTIVSVALALFCLLLYLVAERYRETEFQNRLRAEALTAGHLLVGRERIGPSLYKLMDKNQLTVLPDEEIIIYNGKNQLAYESGTDYLTLTEATLSRIRKQKQVNWKKGDRQIVGLLFIDDRIPFVIIASAVDTYNLRTIQNFAKLLGLGWFLMTGLMVVAGRLFAGRTLRPISQINRQIDDITALNLSQRLPEGDQADELAQLAHRFNRMLNRLEDAFRLQRLFVSHASHELRTPLTAITGQLEVSLLADDDPDELRATIRSVLDDVRGLNRMTNGLLALTNASMDSSTVPMGTVHIDTLFGQIQQEFQRLHPDYTLQVSLPDVTKTDWQVLGNETLLRTAFFNLLDNGGKFSDNHSVSVSLLAELTSVQVKVHNMGSVIPADQLTAIFVPFQRGRNAGGQPGYGIGLPLTERIIQIHKGTIEVESSTESGTTFTVTLPH
ncbi:MULTISPECIES: HAMP domain-containing sensor histidine kinase [unclassified Spirosoma]|uniref:HAMP domain-containing sensor histidine kinase n=1 Tax=unclassified Spirosoma TaxID=2621999 RepID=UPI000962EB7D|nr:MULTISPECIES: HAMP domain-containing sensor histidine kinase [unclassified Spirosoma]MBN8820805.1 HAMP domain-containing histidine kinase [Spirosoma sp.]OJW74567.1 MAG: two-component sensor histidine kinase [Spirosoma sp. 48-14]